MIYSFIDDFLVLIQFTLSLMGLELKLTHWDWTKNKTNTL